MKNFVQRGETLTLTAPYDLASGAGFLAGSIFAVASDAALTGVNVEGATLGVFELTKVGSQAWTVGQAIYWDNTNKRCTSVGTLNMYIGVATEAVASGPTDTKGKVLIGIRAGVNHKSGQHTTVTASDTIVTGLSKVDGVVATLDSDPTDDPEWVSASIGDQAGAPAAGSFLLKTWKNTGGTDPTPAAATTFTKKVNWMAWGT